MSKKQWLPTKVGGEEFDLLNLEHPEVEKEVMREMENGVKVYYDRRWEVTEVLTDWLGQNLDFIKGKKALVLGVGIGAESLLLGKFAKNVWLNDLAPVALQLCGQQMKHNRLQNFTLLPGRYEELELPEVDIVVGSFLVYDGETRAAMEAYLDRFGGELVLMNESLPDFKKLIKKRAGERIFENQEGILGVKLRGSL